MIDIYDIIYTYDGYMIPPDEDKSGYRGAESRNDDRESDNERYNTGQAFGGGRFPPRGG